MSQTNKIVGKIERFETHHRIIAFLIILIGTIIVTRLSVFVHNPNPTFFNFEIHHFDYGVLLLLISSKLLLFGSKRHGLVYLFLTAVASGLIIDDYWFIRQSVVENQIIQTQIYNSTFPSVVIFIIGAILAILFMRSIQRSKKSKK